MMSDFIPLSVPCLRGNELKYVSECIETEWISSVGSYVNRFEEDIARYNNIPYAIACVNGTAALHTSLMLCGVGYGDAVIVPTLTFIAPINTVRYVGAEPIFMDCDDTLNLDPQKLEEFLAKECDQTAKGIRHRQSGQLIRAIIVVHVFGHPANLEPILQTAKKYGLRVIEDATESLGSYYKNINNEKRLAGTLGDVGCYSFNGNKIITSGGGGMIVTRRKDFADKARHLTTQAKSDPLYFKHDAVGYNYRLTNIQAAVGVAQLETLDRFIQLKRRTFLKYAEELAGISDSLLIQEPSYSVSNYWHYALVVGTKPSSSLLVRDQLLAFLKGRCIESRPVWALCHKQEPYKNCLAYRIEKSEWYEKRVLNIPCSVNISDMQIARVVSAIKEFYEIG